MKKKIVFTGGGTAGHIMPNIALIEKLKDKYDISYIGTNAMEKNIIEKEKLPFYEIRTPKFVRGFTLSNLKIPFQLLKSIRECKKILKTINPSIVFSKGGYVSIPVVIASKELHIPIISHESDFTMGLANKIIYMFCNVMCTSFNNFHKKRKCITTGTPIREKLFHGNKNFNPFKQKKSKPTILFIGGSLGAKAINEFVWDNIDKLCEDYNILHITGKNSQRHIEKPNYYQTDFSNNIEDFFASCDIVVTRSGSNTIFELLSLNKRMLLIPLPKGNSRGDQIENALYFKENGFADVLMQENLNIKNFTNKLNLLMKKFDLLKNENQNGNEKIIKIIESTMN